MKKAAFEKPLMLLESRAKLFKKLSEKCVEPSHYTLVLNTKGFQLLKKKSKSSRIPLGTMLVRDNAVPIHIGNLQLLMTEIYKTKWELNPSFMKEIFVEKHSPYGLRSCDNPQLPQARTTCNGLDTISFCGCRLWQVLPNDIKQSNTLSSFKSRIKLWKGEECNRRLCRPFVAQVGFLSCLFKQIFCAVNIAKQKEEENIVNIGNYRKHCKNP